MMTTTNPNTAFKTTDNTHRHNHTILHHIGRRLLLLTSLLAMAVGVKAQLADGVYTINNATGGRGTMCYGKYNGTEYFGMANITLGGHTGKSVTVEDDTNKYWYVTTKNGSTYIYNIGKGTFLQTYAQEAATCAADCDRGLILEAQEAYYRIKSGTYNLAFCCYTLPDAQMRWLESEEAEATLITFTLVNNGLKNYKNEVKAADTKIEDILGFLPKKSNETVSYSYRIVNTRRHVDNSDTRYIYPLTESGAYGRRLKMTSTSTSEQYWFLLDAGEEYYYIVNRATGAYLYHNTSAANNQQIELSATHRTRFKLETSTYQSGGKSYKSYNILPEPNKNDSFNPHGGADGYISIYSKGDGGSHWFFVDEAEFTRCNAPEISLTGQNITITVPTGCIVYYTTNGSVPSTTNGTELSTTSSFAHDGLTTGNTILAVTTNKEQYNSVIAAKALTASPSPNFSFNGDFSKVILKCANNNAVIYYTTNGDTPSYSSANFTGSKEFSVEDFEGMTLKAFTLLDGHLKSAITEFRVKEPQAINSAEDFEKIKTDLAGAFYLTQVITLPDDYESIENFTGTFDGGFHTINGRLNKPLFTTTNGAIIKNVVIKEVQISGGTGNVGAIVGTAQGKTRIYNCGILSGSVGGGTNVGGIAGRIEDASRVINCYSYANITGGTTVGGIVGNNAVASTAGNLQTLVMNCMFYGDITGGTNVSPIYGGKKISNKGAAGDANGINNYNYYRYEANITPTTPTTPITYNCALAAEERYLTRFEFYRHVLNSQRKLCAFYATGDVDDYAEIAKWVLDNGNPNAPDYPILKPWGKYASMMNRAGNNKSDKTLAVTIEGTNAKGGTISATTTLDITNADATTYDYNHYKVQLPYYNEHFTDNYTNDKVVTGWKITKVTTDGTVATYNNFSTTGNNRYNFADRYCTDKDLYNVSGRVFAQGGNYNVPEGVTSITIEPYWGEAVYLSDPYYDVVYLDGTGHGFTPAGETTSEYNKQTVYKTLAEAWTHLNTSASKVYDNAIVLVGNYHSFGDTWSNGSTPFTVMSVDENNDNEPDYGLYCRTAGRLAVNPIRFDFLNHVGVGMAAKEDGRSAMYNLAIWEMSGWFEITETALAIYEEFEYDASAVAKVSAPLILNGGIIAQFGSTAFRSHTADKTPYTIVGGNCYFKNYSPGCNTNTSTPTATKFPPVSILGGEYEQFYLSGGNPAPTPYENYNALCYGNGGKIGTFAGAYQEAIDGDIIIKLDHMLVDEFYGGGVNDKKPITGSINVTINNSRVGLYCGGPKFGNIQAGKTVTTYAENTIFDSFFGGGYGGTSLFRGSNSDSPSGSYPTNWFTTYFANRRGNYYAGTETLDSRFTPEGILVGYETEFFSYAGGGSTNARFYTDYAALSVAEVRNVTSNLKGCTINGDLYGGGNLGKANGDISTTLVDCEVGGSVFAGGFSAAVPTCKVMPETAPTTYASYNSITGIFTPTKYHTPDIYTWAQADATLVHGQKYIDDTKKLIYTKAVDLSDLGTVRGNTSIVIMGASEIAGSVFGGGNASKVIGNTHVHIQGGTIDGNVFGAGNQAEVTGKTEVVIGE